MDSQNLRQWAQPLLEAIAGRRCLYLANNRLGNVGDRMIDAGTLACLREYGVDFYRHPISATISREILATCQVVLLFGSGSVGRSCGNVSLIRHQVAGWGLPCILLPSTAMDTGENLSYCEAVFARDRLSQRMFQATRPAEDVHLMPDLACWHPLPELRARHPGWTERCGVFLRNDSAAVAGWDEYAPALDPVDNCRFPVDYILLASRFGCLKTNRLHFALAGLLAGCRVTLLPASWHKLRSYYLDWHQEYEGRLTWQWTP